MPKVLGAIASCPVYHRVGYPSTRQRVSDCHCMESLSPARSFSDKVIALGHEYIVGGQLLEWSLGRVEHVVIPGIGLPSPLFLVDLEIWQTGR